MYDIRIMMWMCVRYSLKKLDRHFRNCGFWCSFWQHYGFEDSFERMRSMLKIRSFDVGNSQTSFVHGSKQLLFRKSLNDFYYAAICLEADVNCTSTLVPKVLIFLSFHINKYRLISLKQSSFNKSFLTSLLALRFFSTQLTFSIMLSKLVVPVYTLIYVPYFQFYIFSYRISPFEPSEPIDYLFDNEANLPFELGLMPMSAVGPSLTFFRELFRIRGPFLSFWVRLVFQTSIAHVYSNANTQGTTFAQRTNSSFFYSLVNLFSYSLTLWYTFITSAELFSFMLSPCFFHC